MRIVSWNMAHRVSAWYRLLESDADIALLQEACSPPPDVAPKIETDSEPWSTDGDGFRVRWRTAVVRLTDRAEVRWLRCSPIGHGEQGDFTVSRRGTLSVAEMTTGRGDRLLLASMYGFWEGPHPSTGGSWKYADASVHRLISDLTALVGRQAQHRILAAGDLNIFHGYGDKGSAYWSGRYQTVFSRMEAIGLPLVGPFQPHGRRAHPRPQELPDDSLNVPTNYGIGASAAEAGHQLDYVFASRSIGSGVRVRARNEPAEWGPSDHCQLAIDLASVDAQAPLKAEG